MACSGAGARRRPLHALLVSQVPTTTNKLMIATIDISPAVISNIAGV